MRAWTVVGVEGPPVAGGPGFPVKLPLHLAVEALRSARFQSTASAVTVVELLLAAYPEGAQQTGYPKVSLAGKPLGSGTDTRGARASQRARRGVLACMRLAVASRTSRRACCFAGCVACLKSFRAMTFGGKSRTQSGERPVGYST